MTKHLDVGGHVLLYTDVEGDIAAGADYLDKLIERLGKTHPDLKLDRLNARRLVGQLGLDQVMALGLSSARDGQAFHNKAFFAYGKPRRGLLLMADAPPHEMEVLRQAPGDADIVFESDIKLKSLVQLIETIATDLAGKEAEKIFTNLDEKLPLTSVSWRQLIDRLDTRLVGVVRIDEQRSFPWPDDAKTRIPGFDVLVSIDGLAILFDAYAGMLRVLPNVTATAEGDMEWITIDAGVSGAPWLRPVLAKNMKNGRLFLATNKEFAKEYLADKTAAKKTLEQAADWKRASARFLPKANGLSYVSGAFLGKVGRIVRPLGKGDKDVQTGIDLILDLLPAPGIPFASQQVNMDDGLYAASYATASHKSTLFPAIVAGPMVVAGAVAAAATSGLRKTAKAIVGEVGAQGPSDKNEEATAAPESKQPAQIAAPAPSTVLYKVPLGNAPARGGNAPKVTIVEYSDFQCPFCARVQTTLDELAETHGRDLRLVFKHNPLPFHTHAKAAALAAEAAREQGKFWQMHDLLFAHQQNLEDADLESYAEQIGLDLRRYRAALKGDKLRRRIETDEAELARFGESGTPVFFINGRPLRGAQPIEVWNALVGEEIAKADQKLRQGKPRKNLYNELTKSGLESAR